jgi:hypothetical protein
VKVTGGQGAIITAPFMIFQNPKSKYPIREVLDYIPKVSYCSIASGFMTSKVFALYLDERRANHPDMYGRQKCVYVDNYVGQNTSLEA